MEWIKRDRGFGFYVHTYMNELSIEGKVVVSSLILWWYIPLNFSNIFNFFYQQSTKQQHLKFSVNR